MFEFSSMPIHKTALTEQQPDIFWGARKGVRYLFLFFPNVKSSRNFAVDEPCFLVKSDFSDIDAKYLFTHDFAFSVATV
jgi:hypothetical protein